MTRWTRRPAKPGAPQPEASLRRRLLPLLVAVWFQGFLLWVPVEKLFLSEIGFDPASVGLMAAVYAAVVPIIEIPSGILADRWSRRGVLIISSVALMLCSLIGGLSNNVATYIVSALFVGAYFAMYSGTMDAVVYDTVLEETGDSEAFEKRIGRVRFVESMALVSSSLLGGWLAGLTSTRLMYFLSVPVAALSVVAFLRFREPQLHKTEEDTTLREQLAMTYRTLTERGRLLPIVGLAVLTALVLQVVFEFGPLWLVALAVPAVLYGPYWAALTSTLGVGGLLAGKLPLGRLTTLTAVVALMILASLALTRQTGVAVVTIAQVVLALLVVIASIYVTRLLHDAVPSAVRSGVASGVGAISWMAFLPSALVFGVVSKQSGVQSASWLITGATVLVGGLLFALAIRGRAQPEVAQQEAALETRSGERGHAWNLHGSGDLVSDLSCAEFVELVTAFLDGALDPISERRLVDHLPNCVGCSRYLDQIQQTIRSLGDVPPEGLRPADREVLISAFRDGLR
ncbi:MAG: MFS transporter [Jiangellaceae bacterium]|nr:MFS transporter [Jiangellaceae bacterium]